MTDTSLTRAYSVEAAAAAYDVSVSTIRRAIRKDKPDGKFPPPLPAKRKGSSGGFSIHVDDLDAWHEAWPDAL